MKKNIDYIRELEPNKLAEFILHKADKIYRRYTDSTKGLEQWLEEEANEQELYFFDII